MIAAALLLLTLYADAPAPKPTPSPRTRAETPEPPDIPPLPAADAPTDPPGSRPPDLSYTRCTDGNYFAEGIGCVVPDRWPTVIRTPVAPVPSPEPLSPVAAANAAGLDISSNLGATATLTGDADTAYTPTFWVDVSGPIAFGEGKSLGRIGVGLGLSTAPGATTFSFRDLTAYRSASASIRAGRVIGVLDKIATEVMLEGTFATRLRGDNLPPADKLARGLGIGLRFSSSGNTLFVAKYGFDELTVACAAPIICDGFHSGSTLSFYGHVPIAGGVLFGGSASLSLGSDSALVKRYDVFQISAVVDPVEAVKAIGNRNRRP